MKRKKRDITSAETGMFCITGLLVIVIFIISLAKDYPPGSLAASILCFIIMIYMIMKYKV